MESPSTETPSTEKKHLFDDPKNVRRVIGILVVCCLVLIVLDFTDRHHSFHHDEFPVEGWFSFYAFYGFVACVLLVLIVKEMRKVLMRPADYYDGESTSEVGDLGREDEE